MSENPQKKKFSPLTLLYIFIGLLVLSVVSFAVFEPVQVLPRISLAPGYSFTNQNNEFRSSEDYRGKLTIYNFTYTNCPNDINCPDTTKEMQELRNALEESAPEGLDYALVTVTVDPERDTPEALNLFAAPYLDAEESSVSWDFLTGEPSRIKYMVGGGFSRYYEPIPGESANDYTVSFYPYFVLVDGWGIVRAEYPYASLDYDQVIDDITYLNTEINNSEGAAKYAYEAAHLFRCYP